MHMLESYYMLIHNQGLNREYVCDPSTKLSKSLKNSKLAIIATMSQSISAFCLEQCNDVIEEFVPLKYDKPVQISKKRRSFCCVTAC